MADSGGFLPRHIAILACLLFGAVAACADPYPVESRLDVLHYRFAVTLHDDSDAIEVDATIDIALLDPDLRELTLDLVGTDEPSDGKGMTLRRVAADGTPAAFTHRDNRVRVRLPQERADAGRVRLQLAYDGIPRTGLIIGPNKHGDRSFFSDNWPNKARHWLASVDHVADKATSEMIVNAPSRLQVASNGILVERTNLGSQRTLTHWRQGVPISPWLYVLAAAEFAVQRVDSFEGKAIETWVYWQDRDAGFYDFAEPTRDALAFYASRVGPFEYEKLANIQSNSVGGGMEAASAILYGDDSVSGERPRSRRWQTVIVHEIAHQWFGNSVTEASWDDVWLSEGFATYFTWLYFEHAQGRSALDRYLVEARERAMAFSAEQPDYRVRHADLRDMSDVTTRQIYDKGAWILHMLRTKIGDDSWWRGIRSYYARHRNGTATTADFQREMEQACACNLDTFLNYWLTTGSTVVLDGSWAHDADEGEVHIRLARTGHVTGAPAMGLDAAVYYADRPLPELVSIPLDEQGGELRFDSPSRPVNILLDPGTRLLANWRFTMREP